jgi:hypothetical protein
MQDLLGLKMSISQFGGGVDCLDCLCVPYFHLVFRWYDALLCALVQEHHDMWIFRCSPQNPLKKCC